MILADANLTCRTDPVRLVVPFANPDVGYAPGVNPEDSLVGGGCTADMRYESTPRASESGVGSVLDVETTRCSLYRPTQSGQLVEFVLPPMAIEQRCHAVYPPG